MTSQNKTSLTTSYIKKLIIEYLEYRYGHDRGSICSFTVSKLLRFHGLSLYGMNVALGTVIRYYLNKLVELGLARVEKVHGANGAQLKYFVKRHDIPKIIEVLKQL